MAGNDGRERAFSEGLAERGQFGNDGVDLAPTLEDMLGDLGQRTPLRAGRRYHPLDPGCIGTANDPELGVHYRWVGVRWVGLAEVVQDLIEQIPVLCIIGTGRLV